MAKKRKKKNKRSKRRPWESRRRYGSSSSSKKKKSKKKQPFNPVSQKKKKKKKSSGSKKVRKAAKRITSSLQVQRDQGNARAQQIRNMKIERSPKNIGNTSGRNSRIAAQSRINKLQFGASGVPSGLDPTGVKIALQGGSSWGANDQKRYDAYMRNKGSARNSYGINASGIPDGLDAAGVKAALQGGTSWGPNDQKRYDEYMRSKKIEGLDNDALVDPDRFGPLADQYRASMDRLGKELVQGFTTQLNNQRDELKAQGQRERQQYLDEIARNHASMQMLQQVNAQQQAAMQASMDADRRARAEELYQQQLMMQEQKRQAAAAAAIQAEQQRKATNLANAYVPEQVESLGSVTYGDARTNSTATKKRKAKNNTISSLRMNTGLSKPSSSTAGLQLA